MNPFDEAPEFVELDNRRLRAMSPISAEQMHKKHAALFPRSFVEGKRVLDLGCCLGATGHWCLSMGAASYTGVEVQKTYADTARALLGKYHPGKAVVEEAPVEEWLQEEHPQYDVVSILGVLYVFVDYYSILKRICGLARESVMIESLYPDLSKFGPDFYGVEFWRAQRINVADENVSLTGRGSRVSPGGLLFVMRDFGFRSHEGVILPEKITGSKDLFNEAEVPHNARFLMRFLRSDRVAQNLSEDLRGDQAGEKVPW